LEECGRRQFWHIIFSMQAAGFKKHVGIKILVIWLWYCVCFHVITFSWKERTAYSGSRFLWKFDNHVPDSMASQLSRPLSNFPCLLGCDEM
jgi:hypothetical protein